MKLNAGMCRQTDIFTGRHSWRPFHPELHLDNWRFETGGLIGLKFAWLGWCAFLAVMWVNAKEHV